jgi:hypothetical protein
LSSAILYLAIVAIWAVVLVPRWLRPRSAPPRPVPVPAEPPADWSESAGPSQDASPAWAPSADVADEPVAEACADVPGEDADEEEPEAAAEPDAAEPDAGVEPSAGAEADAGVEPSAGAEADAGAEPSAGASPAIRRAEVVKARRRLLTTLVTLTAIAAALVVTRIDAYWIAIPPAVLLAGYLVLLRKFAAIDAERARRAARRRHAEARARARAGAGQEPAVSGEPLLAAPPAPEPGLGMTPDTQPYGAEIIDISGRIGDQVYDQYSDAANRAVGD